MAKSKKSWRGVAAAPPASGKPQWIYGHHAVVAALANPDRHVFRLLLTREAAAELRDFDADDHPDTETQILDRREIDKALPPGSVHQGFAALAAPLPNRDLRDIAASAENDSVILLLDQAQDPRNVGAILRSASAFGALAVVIPDRGTPDATAVLAKAASGAMDRVPLVRVTNLVRAMEQLKDAGFWCAGLDGSAGQTLAEAKLSGRIALVLGSEGTGLRRLTAEKCDYLLRIPISAEQESLNLSNAAAVALYELRRV